MALNVKTLLTRSLSGAVFVVLLVGSLLWNYYSFTLFFGLVSILALNEFYKISEKLGAAPYKMVGFALGFLMYVTATQFNYFAKDAVFNLWTIRTFHGILILSVFIIMAVAMFSKRENPLPNALYTILGLMYAVLPFALLHQLVFFNPSYVTPVNYNPEWLLGIIFLIWSNDTFAYLGGSLFGKHKMIPRISPGKTWEGTVFGVVVSFGISFLINNYMVKSDQKTWMILGVLVPVLATVGDLVESMLKRQAGVKDSGNLMPGHGGALDRFDSLIFVTPFVVALFFYL